VNSPGRKKLRRMERRRDCGKTKRRKRELQHLRGRILIITYLHCHKDKDQQGLFVYY